jgi:hypothetical protein
MELIEKIKDFLRMDEWTIPTSDSIINILIVVAIVAVIVFVIVGILKNIMWVWVAVAISAMLIGFINPSQWDDFKTSVVETFNGAVEPLRDNDYSGLIKDSGLND